MSAVRKAEAVVARLQAKRARLIARGVEIGDQRAPSLTTRNIGCSTGAVTRFPSPAG